MVFLDLLHLCTGFIQESQDLKMFCVYLHLQWVVVNQKGTKEISLSISVHSLENLEKILMDMMEWVWPMTNPEWRLTLLNAIAAFPNLPICPGGGVARLAR